MRVKQGNYNVGEDILNFEITLKQKCYETNQ